MAVKMYINIPEVALDTSQMEPWAFYNDLHGYVYFALPIEGETELAGFLKVPPPTHGYEIPCLVEPDSIPFPLSKCGSGTTLTIREYDSHPNDQVGE